MIFIGILSTELSKLIKQNRYKKYIRSVLGWPGWLIENWLSELSWLWRREESRGTKGPWTVSHSYSCTYLIGSYTCIHAHITNTIMYPCPWTSKVGIGVVLSSALLYSCCLACWRGEQKDKRRGLTYITFLVLKNMLTSTLLIWYIKVNIENFIEKTREREQKYAYMVSVVCGGW